MCTHTVFYVFMYLQAVEWSVMCRCTDYFCRLQWAIISVPLYGCLQSFEKVVMQFKLLFMWWLPTFKLPSTDNKLMGLWSSQHARVMSLQVVFYGLQAADGASPLWKTQAQVGGCSNLNGSEPTMKAIGSFPSTPSGKPASLGFCLHAQFLVI